MKHSGNLGLRATSFKYISTGVAALSVLAFSVQADAADIYAPMGPAPFPVAAPLASLWSGFYVGAHVGGAWSDLKTTDLDSYWFKDAENFNRFLRDSDPIRNGRIITNPFLFGPLKTDQSPSAVFGGGTIGYNIQRGGLVAGIEADFGDMGLHSSQLLSSAPVNFQHRDGLIPALVPFNNTPLPYTETARANISTGFYGDLTGRLGWAWGPWMFYGKGGLAVLEAKTDVTNATYSFTTGTGLSAFTRTYNNFGAADNDSRVGWTAGAGFEYLWNQAWSVKVEYQFFDFGTMSSSLKQTQVVTFADGSPPEIKKGDTFSFNHSLDINTVKVGINYHLGCCDTPIVPFK